MEKTFRSNCSINCALELVGDKWTLLIMRDILIRNKRTFKQFSSSDEGIATNILSNRLAMLEEYGLITKGKLPDNKKVNIYTPTERGVDLLPVIAELAVWSGKHKAHFNPELADEGVEAAEFYQQNKVASLEQVKQQFADAN